MDQQIPVLVHTSDEWGELVAGNASDHENQGLKLKTDGTRA